MYGMGEKTIVEVADALNSGLDVKDITYIDGTVFKTKEPDDSLPTVTLPSFAEIKADRRRYAESFKIQYANCRPLHRQAAGGALRRISSWCRIRPRSP